MRFVFLLLLLVAPVYGENIVLDDTPNEVVAVQALIDRFDDTTLVIRTDVYAVTPAFVIYAEAAASFGDCAVDPLIAALDEGGQIRLAAAIGLQAVGPAAIKAKPFLIEMLASQSDRENILACGIIQGIGPNAVELVPQLRKLLSSDNFHVQYWACRGLSSIGPGAEDAVHDLLLWLKYGVASVRRNAAIAIGNIGPGLACPLIIERLTVALDDRSVPVREAAQEALLKLSP
jgi:HEAT repeat protein